MLFLREERPELPSVQVRTTNLPEVRSAATSRLWKTRINKLQAKLEEAQARKPSVVSIPDDETTSGSRRPSEQVQEPQTPTTSRAQKRKEVTAIDDLVFRLWLSFSQCDSARLLWLYYGHVLREIDSFSMFQRRTTARNYQGAPTTLCSHTAGPILPEQCFCIATSV